MYKIKRVCWCEKTFNGYLDSPYWEIEFDYYRIGLKDDGDYWDISNTLKDTIYSENILEMLKRICTECRLNILPMKKKEYSQNVSYMNSI